MARLLSNVLQIGRMKMSVFLLLAMLALSTIANASESAEAGHGEYAESFLWVALILVIAKLSGIVEKIKLPPVLGELIAGIILGNLALWGLHWFEPLKTSSYVAFLAEFGVVILLFQTGLESNIQEMRKVGLRAFLVALVGVVAPFALTMLLAPMLLPGLSNNAYLFIGATLTATSVGITARVFRDLGTLKSKESQIVLGAAVIDDVLGLLILAVVSAIVLTGTVSVAEVSIIVVKAVGFLAGAILLGQSIAKSLGKYLSKINDGIGMKLALAIGFALALAYLAGIIGLAPIVGAFAAGLVLDPLHFRGFKDPDIVISLKKTASSLTDKAKGAIDSVIRHHADHHVEEVVSPIAHMLVPIFFVMTGVQVKLETMSDPKILAVALAVTAIAIAGKIVAGSVAGKANKLLIGVGMVPRGEVGLIFANVGKALGVVDDRVFSVVVIMVVLTTLLTPPALTILQRKASRKSSDGTKLEPAVPTLQ